MDTETLYTISVIISLCIIAALLQRKASESSEKELKALDFSSYTIAGLLVISMLYSDGNVHFVIMLALVCLPVSVYSYYRSYKLNKKRTLVSIIAIISIVVILLVAPNL